MKYLSYPLLLAFCFVASPALAHPGTGIVSDRTGNIFFTDLKHVWMRSPDGRLKIAVRNVHTHELYRDHDDNLYGEHLWYNGEERDTWGHRVWRRTPDGTVSDVISSRRGFRDDYDDFPFVHDTSGNAYWVDRGETTFVRRRSPDGSVITLASRRFRNVRSILAPEENLVFLIDLYNLVRIWPDGKVSVFVENLADWTFWRLLGPDTHALMGMWAGREGDVYVADHSSGKVKKISRDAAVTVVYTSARGWKPTGGLVTKDQEVWILEYSMANEARIRKLSASPR